MIPHKWSAELSDSIERTLFEQARKNELLIAYIRVISLSLVATGDWVAHVRPPLGVTIFPRSIPMVTSAWAVLAAVIAVALHRGWYRPGLRVFFPACDGLFLAGALLNQATALGPEGFRAIGAATTAALACAVFAATGALRLTRLAAAVTAAIALATFASVTIAFVGWTAVSAIQCGLLFGLGLLSVWLTDIVRRAMQSEVGRSTLQRFLPNRVVSVAYEDTTSELGSAHLMSLLTEPRSVDATILITDLRGFTAMSEKLSPGEVLAFLNEVQGELADVVREHDGTVDKFLGDGMLAVFGAPEPLEAHAERAVAAVLVMHDRLDRLNERRAVRGEKALRLGVGIHSGAIVTGCLGSGTRLEFTVIGDTVNTASRLEALTKEKGVEVLISDETARRIPAEARGALFGARFRLEAIGEAPIRGRRETLSLHTLVDARATQAA